MLVDNIVNTTLNKITNDYDVDITNQKNISMILQDILGIIDDVISSKSDLISYSDGNFFLPLITEMVISYLSQIYMSDDEVNKFAHDCVSELNDLYTCVGGANDHSELIAMFKKIAVDKIFDKHSIYQLFKNENDYMSLDDSIILEEENPLFDDIYNIVQQNLAKIIPDNSHSKEDIEILKTEITQLREENNQLEDKIREITPIENQCCICFGYTKKQQVCVPCGHTQYCTCCIARLDRCALCNADITNIIKIY